MSTSKIIDTLEFQTWFADLSSRGRKSGIFVSEDHLHAVAEIFVIGPRKNLVKCLSQYEQFTKRLPKLIKFLQS